MSEIMMNRATGVVKSVGNVRDYEYGAYVGTSEIINNFPKKFQLDPQTIKDQGSVGECAGCAMATVHEAHYGREFSENWAYSRLRSSKHDGVGMFLDHAVQYLKEIGIVPREMYDVLLEMPEAKEAVAKFPELDEEAKKYPLAGFVKIHMGDTATGGRKDLEIKDAITRYKLPLFAASSDYFRSGHAFVLLGWDDEEDKYIFQNSWGEKYGDNGVSSIPKDEVDEVYVFLYEPIKLPFTDVVECENGDWFANDVKQCFMSGLIKGKTETMFDPHAPITRAEACAMFNRLMKKVDTSIQSMNKLIALKHEYNQLDIDIKD